MKFFDKCAEFVEVTTIVTLDTAGVVQYDEGVAGSPQEILPSIEPVISFAVAPLMNIGSPVS